MPLEVGPASGGGAGGGGVGTRPWCFWESTLDTQNQSLGYKGYTKKYEIVLPSAVHLEERLTVSQSVS